MEHGSAICIDLARFLVRTARYHVAIITVATASRPLGFGPSALRR
jgi:hypothetical protein